MPAPPQEPYRRQDLKIRLAAEARRLAHAVALVDADDADPASVEATMHEARALAEHIEKLPSLMRHGGPASAPTAAASLNLRSPVSGQSNPIAPPVYLEIRGDTTYGHATYTYAHEGPNHHAHGGVVAAVFDEIVGAAQTASGIAGYTGTLTIKMLRPTPLNRRIDYEAGVDRVEGRKIHVWASASCEGELLTECTAIMIAPAHGGLPGDIAGDAAR
jgi:acyl-coenzyme A thioesterase PaaI-like protein